MDRVKMIKWGVLALTCLLIAVVVWQWPHWRALGQAGSAYAARITCSCRYVEGRSAESCQRDIEEAGSMVSITEMPDEKAIKGSVFMLGHATALYKEGYGCLMQRE